MALDPRRRTWNEKRLDALEKRLDVLLSRLEALGSRFEALEKRLVAFHKRMEVAVWLVFAAVIVQLVLGNSHQLGF